MSAVDAVVVGAGVVGLTSAISLAEGLDCDYMTGAQPYKLRLATGSMPLFRLRATPRQLAAFAPAVPHEMRLAG